MLYETRLRREGDQSLPVLVWQWPTSMRAIASSPHGGGIGYRRWVINAQVPASYARLDPDRHLGKLGVSLGLPRRGVGMLTAADVRSPCYMSDGGAQVTATVGLGRPILAAEPPQNVLPQMVGTINIVAFLPERLSDAALVNAATTVTEAKCQALRDAGFNATGTATDALCIVCPQSGPVAMFGGPRSHWGSRLARAVHGAVLSGALR